MTILKLHALEQRGIHLNCLRGEFDDKNRLVKAWLPAGHGSWARLPAESAERFENRVVHELTAQRDAGPPLYKIWSEGDAKT